jgi:hypothetical protein
MPYRAVHETIGEYVLTRCYGFIPLGTPSAAQLIEIEKETNAPGKAEKQRCLKLPYEIGHQRRSRHLDEK